MPTFPKTPAGRPSFALLPLAAALVAALGAAPASAASFTITGASTTAQTLGSGSGQTGNIGAAGSLTVGGGTVAVTVSGNNATLTNLGTIRQAGTGRVIRDNTGVSNLVVNNGSAANSTALMQSADADVIQMNCYAPLFCNVNPGGMQWSINLIGYDAVSSFGSPAYFVQTMFANNRGDEVLPAAFDPLPKLTGEQIPKAPAQANRGRGGGGGGGPGGGGNGGVDNRQYDGLYVSATRDIVSGDVILKLVNVQADPQPLNIELRGLTTAVAPSASGQVLTAAELGAMNSIAEPTKVSPQPLTINNAGQKFAHELPGHSVSVIRLRMK